MKGKAIVKIVICSVVAAVLIAVLAGSLLAKGVFSSLRSDGLDFPFDGVLNFGTFDESNYSIGSAELTDTVREIDLNWASGNVTVKAYDGTTVVLRETERSAASERLRWKLENGKLTVHEHKSGLSVKTLNKSLELLIPEKQAKTLAKLEVDGASARVYLENLTVQELEIDTASGNVELQGCETQKLGIDSASGDCKTTDCVLGEFSMDSASGSAKLHGSVRELNMDTASGNLTVETDKTPEKVEVDTVSGDTLLTLPADASFTLKQSGVSGDVKIEGFAATVSGKTYVCGDGSAEFKFESVSGDVTVRAAQ